MKTRIFVLSRLVVCIVLLLAVLPGGITSAQGPQPPQPTGSLPDSGPQRGPNGTWYIPTDSTLPGPSAPATALATGGPDGFGYTWDDSVPLNWIDATSGTDTGLSSSGDEVGPLSLPFSFKYYENTYSSLYVVRSGYVGFTHYDSWDSQPRVPSAATPNNVIAPYATPINLASTGPANRVYYKSGGAAPNRYFVVEWYEVQSGDRVYTFEAILHENGDIVFQYLAMGSAYYCATAAIEDSTGQDGLTYVGFCNQPPSNKAVRFYRPARSARVGIQTLYQGGFTHAGAVDAFTVPIRNTGELGTDTYDIVVSSPWPATLYAADGTTLLSDTDGDGTRDTGPVAQGGSATVVVRVHTPDTVELGDSNATLATVRSSLDTSKHRTVTLQSSVPAAFAQVFKDDANGAMSLYLAQPDSQTLRKATPDWQYGYNMAVAESPSGFAYFWGRYDWTGSVSTERIEFTLLDRSGNAVREVTKLTDHSAATVNTEDYAPAVAVAPNGHIGVLWSRQLTSSDWNRYNYNIYFAVLYASGELLYGPTNLTNNTAWGRYDDVGLPHYYDARITATADNRFVLAWQRFSYETPSGSCSSWCHLQDVYYGVRDANGGEVKAATRLTRGMVGGAQYGSPGLATLSGNRALVAYQGPYGIACAFLDSAGNVVHAAVHVGGGGSPSDAVQLSSGNIVVAWNADRTIGFVVLDGTSYAVIAEAASLHHPAASTGDAYVSVAADGAGHAILTWMDGDYWSRRNLYYALVDGAGNVVSEPQIFQTSQASVPIIESSYTGYGNTSYTLTAPLVRADLVVTAPARSGVAPGGVAAIPVRVANQSTTSTTAIVLTATLDSSLGYAGARPEPSLVVTPTVVWTLGDLGFLGSAQVMLYTTVPASALGTHYPVAWTVASAATDASPADNSATTEVMVSLQVFLPLILKGH